MDGLQGCLEFRNSEVDSDAHTDAAQAHSRVQRQRGVDAVECFACIRPSERQKGDTVRENSALTN